MTRDSRGIGARSDGASRCVAGPNHLGKGEIGLRSLFGRRGGRCGVASSAPQGQDSIGKRWVVDYQLTRWSNSYSGTGSGVLGSTCELWSSPGESSGGPRAGATRGASMGNPRWPRMALTDDCRDAGGRATQEQLPRTAR